MSFVTDALTKMQTLAVASTSLTSARTVTGAAQLFALDGCNEIYVYADRIQGGGPGVSPDSRTSQQRAIVPMVQVNALLTWCIGDGQVIPTDEQVTAESLAILDDVTSYASALMQAITSGDFAGCSSAKFIQAVPQGPSGARVGWVFTIQLTR